jgi:N4-gp56 family major capsid protein
MVDLHGRPAFRPVETYAAAGNVANGEIGAIGQFRVIIAPEMMSWHGAGAAATNPSFRQTAGHYDVLPMLVVGSGCFTHIGFQTNGKNVKFKIFHKRPGREMVSSHDPYGEKGVWSIKWYYGIMILRPEWLALVKTAAKY